jgi:hypothetical protein
MIFVLLWGSVLGFVNVYNAAIWVLIMMTGIGGLTILGLLIEESGDWDYHAPKRTYSSRSSRIVHIERPHTRINDYDFDDDHY